MADKVGEEDEGEGSPEDDGVGFSSIYSTSQRSSDSSSSNRSNRGVEAAALDDKVLGSSGRRHFTTKYSSLLFYIGRVAIVALASGIAMAVPEFELLVSGFSI